MPRPKGEGFAREIGESNRVLLFLRATPSRSFDVCLFDGHRILDKIGLPSMVN